MKIKPATWVACLVLMGGNASCAAAVRDQGPPAAAASAAAASGKSAASEKQTSPSADSAGEQGVGTSDAPSSSEVEALALTTLSGHLSRPAEEIEVVSVTAIDWRDSSLGCPKPDRSYLQVITPGHYAVLRHRGTSYRVHMANGRGFVCEGAGGKADAKRLPVPMLALPLEQLRRLASADLARRLEVPVEQISLARTQSVIWPDASLGCPVTGQSYERAQSKGHVFEFTHRGRVYTYHTDLRRVFPCPPLERE